MLRLGVTGTRSRVAEAVEISDIVDVEQLAYIIADKNGIIRKAGGDITSVTGQKDADLYIGRLIFDVLESYELRNLDGSPCLTREQVRSLITAMQEETEPHRLEAMAISKTGRRLSLCTRLRGDGTLLTTLRDLTPVLENRDRLEAAMSVGNAGYWSLDLKTHNYTFSKSVFNRLSHRERDMIHRRGLFAIIHKDDVGMVAQKWTRALRGAAEFDFVYRVVTVRDGLMWQRSIGYIEKGSDGVAIRVTSFVMDITAEMQTRQALDRARKDEAIKVNSLSNMGQELRGPLKSIFGLLENIDDENLPETITETVSNIKTEAKHLQAILVDALGQDPGTKSPKIVKKNAPEALDLPKLIASCASEWRTTIEEKGLSFDIRHDKSVPDSLPFYADDIRSCLNELLSFAVRMTKLGRICMTTKRIHLKGQDHIAVILRDSSETVMNGFPEDLFTIRKKVEGLGGRLVRKVRPGEGQAHILLIPCILQTQREETKTTSKSEKIYDPRIAGLSVLCVEDNPVGQNVVERLIGTSVRQLHFASHGKEALALLDILDIDIVLMDIHMPVMDGVETTMKIRAAKAKYSDVLIIALTADPDYRQVRMCRHIGMNDAMAKPVRREDILNAFERVLLERDQAQQKDEETAMAA